MVLTALYVEGNTIHNKKRNSYTLPICVPLEHETLNVQRKYYSLWYVFFPSVRINGYAHKYLINKIKQKIWKKNRTNTQLFKIQLKRTFCCLI